ncbi:hypothetical protein SH139x_003148 [Planctomycetaceae bacterium SH139]
MPQPPQNAAETLVNPYAAPIPTEPSRPIYRQAHEANRYGKLSQFSRGLGAAMLVGAPIAAGLAYWKILTIIVSGPIYLVVGLLQACLSIRWAPRHYLWIAVPFLLCVFTVLLVINLFSLSPAQAQTPVSLGICGFALLIQPAWLLLIKSPQQQMLPTQEQVDEAAEFTSP